MPAPLHSERIARGDAVPSRWLLFTHGIYGAGMNWRGIARKINERRPEWGCCSSISASTAAPGP
ncbi:MAG: hypothetical protein NT062_23135, partial [Proteobacteria bacterium]|nr:hypothetical protein [Pseudomonadota bacterium]